MGEKYCYHRPRWLNSVRETSQHLYFDEYECRGSMDIKLAKERITKQIG